ncbi:hypothetical protein Efla_001141 [Eimeria flavescens]
MGFADCFPELCVHRRVPAGRRAACIIAEDESLCGKHSFCSSHSHPVIVPSVCGKRPRGESAAAESSALTSRTVGPLWKQFRTDLRSLLSSGVLPENSGISDGHQPSRGYLEGLEGARQDRGAGGLQAEETRSDYSTFTINCGAPAHSLHASHFYKAANGFLRQVHFERQQRRHTQPEEASGGGACKLPAVAARSLPVTERQLEDERKAGQKQTAPSHPAEASRFVAQANSSSSGSSSKGSSGSSPATRSSLNRQAADGCLLACRNPICGNSADTRQTDCGGRQQAEPYSLQKTLFFFSFALRTESH